MDDQEAREPLTIKSVPVRTKEKFRKYCAITGLPQADLFAMAMDNEAARVDASKLLPPDEQWRLQPEHPEMPARMPAGIPLREQMEMAALLAQASGKPIPNHLRAHLSVQLDDACRAARGMPARRERITGPRNRIPGPTIDAGALPTSIATTQEPFGSTPTQGAN